MFEACIPNRFYQDILRGLHEPGESYKLALYLQSAATDKNCDSMSYNSTGELPEAGGYTRGGKELSGFTVGAAGKRAFLDFTDPEWPAASFSADAAVLYNASKGNAVLSVFAFPLTKVSDLTFGVHLPRHVGVIVIA
jgi:hypothetical protein